MHDAQEAYIGDMVRPMKRFFTPWRRIEKRILMNIAEKFGLDWPPPEILKTWDSSLLFTEARDLMPTGTTCKAAVQNAPLMDITIKPMDAHAAETLFLELFEDLFKGGADADQQSEPKAVPAKLEGDQDADPAPGKGKVRLSGGVRSKPRKRRVRKKKRVDGPVANSRKDQGRAHDRPLGQGPTS